MDLILNIFILKKEIISQVNCGNKIPDLAIYEKISQYSIWIALAIAIGAILLDQKIIKKILFILALFPIMSWGYVNFIVDYSRLKKEIFAYNAMAEATLANIAEAQDRYKSEQGTYIGDLRKLYSHIGGAGGMNECVKILSVQAGFDHWRSEAKHLSSPKTVIWDSRAGTSLKKG
ncbi:MAG: hypothetical protein VX579_00965 [Nitrospinota bacterium]|nr:hypothetical protein [Nitrospinota bacterium]